MWGICLAPCHIFLRLRLRKIWLSAGKVSPPHPSNQAALVENFFTDVITQLDRGGSSQLKSNYAKCSFFTVQNMCKKRDSKMRFKPSKRLGKTRPRPTPLWLPRTTSRTWRRCWKPWKPTTTSRMSGTTGKNNWFRKTPFRRGRRGVFCLSVAFFLQME